MLDLPAGDHTEPTALDLLRRKPPPFPPEPVRSIGIGLTQHFTARANRSQGRNKVLTYCTSATW
ncbi:hypothetical protein ACNPQM_14355 [Streptomyces sp. NPDC056231]|uniref:hypothetical protein n=1 Tax=Streptomyces sp. NPDC056231 TaxID=3345755 RepID=UPI003AAC99F2